MNVQTYIEGLVDVPTGVRNLADLIAFDTAHASEELVAPFWTDQSTYVNTLCVSQYSTFISYIASSRRRQK